MACESCLTSLLPGSMSSSAWAQGTRVHRYCIASILLLRLQSESYSVRLSINDDLAIHSFTPFSCARFRLKSLALVYLCFGFNHMNITLTVRLSLELDSRPCVALSSHFFGRTCGYVLTAAKTRQLARKLRSEGIVQL